MELIGPRSRDHVDLPADRAAVLRRQDALDDLHLGDRLDAQDLDLVLAAVVAEAAVFRVGLGAAAVDGDGAATIADAVHAERPAASDCAVRRIHTWREQDDVLQISPRNRDLLHFRSDRLHLGRRRRLHERRGLGDRHRFLDVADFEHVGLADGLSGAEIQPLAVVGLESGELDLDRIRSGRQRRQRELAALVGHGFAHEIGPLMRHDDGDARQDRAGAVVHDAVERRGDHLRARRRRRERDCDDQQENGGAKPPQIPHRDLLVAVILNGGSSVISK